MFINLCFKSLYSFIDEVPPRSIQWIILEKKSSNTVRISWFSRWKTCWIGTTGCDTKMVRGSGDPPKPGGDDTKKHRISAKIKKYGQCCKIFLRIIHWIERGGTWSMKEYNNLKQRLMISGMKNLIYIWLLTST